MREIKFRAWDGEKMHYQVRFGGVKDGIPLSPSVWDEKFGWTILSGNPVLEIMQFTGLYDKNGKEIYEGDICRYHNIHTKNAVWVVVFKDAKFYLEAQNMLRFALGSVDLRCVEVIGNVFENQELVDAYFADVAYQTKSVQ